MDHRQFGGVLAATAAPLVAAGGAAADDKKPQASEDRFPDMHQGRKPVVGMLLYPGLTLMDMLGLQTTLPFTCEFHLL